MDEETINTDGTTGDPVLDPVSDPPPAEDPIQVVSVNELLELLHSANEETEEPAAEDEEEPAEPALSDQYFASMLEDTSSAEAVQLLSEIKAELIQADLDPHPLLTTSFADYTVTEGLLLLVLLGGVVSACCKMIRRGFEWLTW